MTKNERQTARQAAIVSYTKTLIYGVMEWYTHPSSGAVDCDETRRAINKDLDSVLPRVQEKFGLRKIPKVLRARAEGNGMFVVRLEDPNLN
jgi:hypothetical protein